MVFSATEMIKQRKSVRTFDGRELTAADRESLVDYISRMDNPFHVSVDFRLLDAKEYDLSSPVISGANTYMAAKVKRVEHFEIAYGYSFEKACLYALSLGIGTVMLAASLSRSTFEKAMDVQEDEVLPTASPVGYPAEKRSVLERLMRKALKADDRILFSKLFFDGSFDKGLSKEAAAEGDLGVFAESLEMARLAPSAANKQPWRAVVERDRVHFYEYQTMKESPLGDVQKVDVGIALCHFDMSMEEAGIAGEFVFEEPEIKAPEGVHYIVTYILPH